MDDQMFLRFTVDLGSFFGLDFLRSEGHLELLRLRKSDRVRR